MKIVLSRDKLRKLGRDERTPKREETHSSVIALSTSKPEIAWFVQNYLPLKLSAIMVCFVAGVPSGVPSGEEEVEISNSFRVSIPLSVREHPFKFIVSSFVR